MVPGEVKSVARIHSRRTVETDELERRSGITVKLSPVSFMLGQSRARMQPSLLVAVGLITLVMGQCSAWSDEGDDPFGLMDGCRERLQAIERPESLSVSPESSVRLADWDDVLQDGNRPAIIQQTAMQIRPNGQNVSGYANIAAGSADARSFEGDFSNDRRAFNVGVDLYSPPEFEGGLLVFGRNVAMKIGGYAKADFIYDANPIDSTDSFDTTSIPVGAPPRTNFRAHARETRLSIDARWKVDGRLVRMFVEGDFFSNNDQFRLRHAYGEIGNFLVGRTWTTFTDVAAAPATIDFEGSVSSVNRRQAQLRLTGDWVEDVLTWSIAIEDARFIVIPPPTVQGETRSPSPDFVARSRWTLDWAQFQLAGLYRNGGFQPENEEVLRGGAYGTNLTGVVLLLPSSKVYTQVLAGRGIGSYRGLPDAAPTGPTSAVALPLFAWMIGATHDWNDSLSSNVTYAENHLDNTSLQSSDEVKSTTYLAANILWKPIRRVRVGIEYLYGTRTNVNRESGAANRLQAAMIFLLP